PDVRAGGGLGIRARKFFGRPRLRVARPADPLLMMWRSPTLVAGGAILIVVIGMSLASPWIAPYPTTEQHMLHRLKAPGAQFVLGTDQYGRDLLSRTLAGARPALALGLGAVALGLALGVPIGLATGYVGGRFDDVVMRVVDALLAFPALL